MAVVHVETRVNHTFSTRLVIKCPQICVFYPFKQGGDLNLTWLHTTSHPFLFKNFCSAFEIVCLQETWGRSEGDFTDLLLNYQPFVSIRSSNEHFSGGVAIHVKDEIAQGCNRILNEVKDAVFLKLDKQFFGWENDIVLGSLLVVCI